MAAEATMIAGGDGGAEEYGGESLIRDNVALRQRYHGDDVMRRFWARFVGRFEARASRHALLFFSAIKIRMK